MKRVLLSFVGTMCAAPAVAQVPVSPGIATPSPLTPIGGEPGIDALRVDLQRSRLAEFARGDAVTLTGFPLADGSLVDLDLVRIRHERMKFGFVVDEIARPDLLSGLDLSLWKGTVRGVADSEVNLSFATTGPQGWVRVGGRTMHVLPRPDAAGDWTRGDALVVEETVLNARGMRLDSSCSTLEVPGVAEQRGSPLVRSASPQSQGQHQVSVGACTLRECRIAIETDFQWFQRFGSLSAQTAYTTTLLGFVSDRYEQQISTVLTYPYVGFYTTSNDPWSAQDSGGNSGDVLDEFRAAWAGNVPADAVLGHFMSGASLGGGVAYLNVLCNTSFNFGVSGSMNGSIPFPIAQGPNNWDFIVVSHEIGHNFDALHTHDYCPPLDSCAPAAYFGQCQTTQTCTNQGTIMSYCHLCSGGTSNITTFFHPTSVADMTAAANSCLPIASGITAVVPTSAAPNVPTPVTVNVTGTPTAGVQLRWRPNATTAYATIQLTSLGSGNYSGNLPAFACGDTPRFYFTYTDATCGTFTDPPNAPTNSYPLALGTWSTLIQDNFQTDLGWTPANLGATSGDWQRGVPVNDSGWQYDPSSDGDGSGMCWLTQNTAGNSDVDGGAVQLTSPPVDLSGTDVTLEFRYYLRLTENDGSDGLTVQISPNGTSGPWGEVIHYGQNGGSQWRTATFDRADLLAAGVALTSNARVRFIAADNAGGHIVEAGIDAFRIQRFGCGSVGVNYCTSTGNSGGGPAILTATGSASIAANNLVLRAAPVPANSNGLFYCGPTQTQVPFGDGFRCVAGSTLRLGIVAASGGALTTGVNYTLPPALGAIVPGSIWNFQVWFRDVAAAGALFNLSNGLRIQFTP